MKTGFTLIELLVVVLIIGILSAVALPEYQTAVEKSRYAALFPLAKALKDAEEAFYLANGYYAASSDRLDVDVGEFTCRAGDCSVMNFKNGTMIDLLQYADDLWLTAYTKQGTALRLYFDRHKTYPGQRWCSGNERLCKSMGGTSVNGSWYLLP